MNVVVSKVMNLICYYFCQMIFCFYEEKVLQVSTVLTNSFVGGLLSFVVLLCLILVFSVS